VYVNIGEKFAVDDGYDAMGEEILRYITDKGYYSEKSEIARGTVHTMLESADTYMMDALVELEQRIELKEYGR
jgi:hypothetical protein